MSDKTKERELIGKITGSRFKKAEILLKSPLNIAQNTIAPIQLWIKGNGSADNPGLNVEDGNKALLSFYRLLKTVIAIPVVTGMTLVKIYGDISKESENIRKSRAELRELKRKKETPKTDINKEGSGREESNKPNEPQETGSKRVEQNLNKDIEENPREKTTKLSDKSFASKYPKRSHIDMATESKNTRQQ